MPFLWGLTLLSLASQDTARIRALLDIEDARPRDIAALAPLIDAARSSDTLVARWAIRGLGRQQRADLLPILIEALGSPAPRLRAEAANAIGQSSLREGTADARRALEDRLKVETSVEAYGTILRTLGRLPVANREERDRTEAALIQGLDPSLRSSADAALGLASLYRRTAQTQPPGSSSSTLASLVYPGNRSEATPREMAALVSSGKADSATLLRALGANHRETRRLAALAAFAYPTLQGRNAVIARAWKDGVAAVRYEAVRALARHADGGCDRLPAVLEDRNLHLRILAIDLLGACGSAAAQRLVTLARYPLTPSAWHVPAHAIVALATADPAAALELLPRFRVSDVWWARMYAARAAEALGADSVLRRLATDRNPNVREAALSGLSRRVGHAADSLYIAALEAQDYQLLQTAATALDSSPDPRAVPALWSTFKRLRAELRETSRDPRMAMLSSIEHIGSAPLADELRDAAGDFDSTVAQTAARMASRWSAVNVTPATQPLPRRPVPSWTDLVGWSRTTALMIMAGGGTIRIRLRPFDAPTNVARFVRMVQSGWFTGLTFHRVVPNFVVQGGSPGANEYMGDGPFTRDELGLESHVRGTVGISTRGRDTGDGQIFINLIDNWRLDHDYTIIGEIVSGMNVVDAMQEGAAIQRVTLIMDRS